MPLSVVETILGTGGTSISDNEFVSKPLHKDEVIDHDAGITQEGWQRWYKAGTRHCQQVKFNRS